MADNKEQNKTAAAIEVGKQITVEGATRGEARTKVLSLIEQATAQGLTCEGGFIMKKGGTFTTEIKFVK